MHSWWMSHMLAAGVLCALVTSIPVSHGLQHKASLPCAHPLRIVAPHLFTHCGTICAYSDWTSWRRISITSNTSNNCSSGKYYVQQRTRQVVSMIGDKADCNEVNETQNIQCYYTKEEKLIVSLGLGGSGQNIDSAVTPLMVSPSNYHDIVNESLFPPPLILELILNRKRRSQTVYGDGTRCPHKNSTGEVCQHLSASRLCRRAADETYSNKKPMERLSDSNSMGLMHETSNPISFNWEVHGSHFRQRRQTRCSDHDTQHVLFILDSSGSIGRSDFGEMKEAIAKLVPLFCKKIKTALINFSSDIRLEYCFDCFKNTLLGRNSASDAIKGAEYLGECTNTAATARCVCQNILDGSCGISSSPDCLDVIFITDGHSNDPTLRVCDEIKCLHDQAGINTYAIGIGGYDHNELDCIDNSSDDFGVLEYETFQEFKESIDKVVALVTNATLGGNYYSCATRDGSFSPTGSPFAG